MSARTYVVCDADTAACVVAVRLYQRHGFVLSPLGECVMLMPMQTVRASFED